MFMMQSLMSSYKDVAHILPVSRISAEELHCVLRRVIINLEDAGFHVVAVIIDSNSISRKVMFRFGRSNGPRPQSSTTGAAIASSCSKEKQQLLLLAAVKERKRK